MRAAYRNDMFSLDGGSRPSDGHLRNPQLLFQPGRNCWRVEEARRAAILVDGAPFFAALDSALRQARRTIVIIGWDFDGRIFLRPDAPEGKRIALGPLLRQLVEENPALEVRILVWSVAVLHAPGAPLPLLLGAAWERHPRISLRLDTFHPLYAAHHQKIITIDDSVAFAGGMDLTVDRWDTPRHDPDEPLRRDPDGNAFPPVHDIQMLVDGDAAAALAALARRRWRFATGEALSRVRQRSDPWPTSLDAEMTSVPVAIARTSPRWGDQPAVREAAALTLDMLRQARHAIYIEAQYMTSRAIGRVLEELLARSRGPDIVILMAGASHGFLERVVMGRNRDWLLYRLKKKDRFNRLRAYYPVVPAGCDERQVLVHSKLIIVDDRYLRVGSSNLNNRSIGLDTECDLGVQARDQATARAIAALRDRLLAEHLDVLPADMSKAIAAEGSLVTAIESLNVRPRGLRSFKALHEGVRRPLPLTWLLDPKRPFEPLWFARRRGGLGSRGRS
jgi:phosphatidylserine/phosphatidylglycerophosphate/cardiolipin synthase-like enzyme